jgi:Prenyltransferase and squalene oxidase repeat
MKTRPCPAGFVAVFTAIIGFGAALCVPLPVAKADDAAADAAAARERAVGRATERGLSWLAGRYDNGLPPESEAPVAVVSLSGLAFLEAGATPDHGRYGTALRRCIDGIVDRADPKSGLIADKANPVGAMYGHGYATLFLAEAYAKTRDDRLKETLARAVDLIGRAQNREGGWRYSPKPMDADVSVTACQLMALTAAKRVGLTVPDGVIERGVAFVKKCQNPDGGFNYMAGQGIGGSGLARSAAAVAALQRADAGDRGKDYNGAMAYLARVLLADKPRENGHYYYGAYYAAFAAWVQDGEHRSRLYAAVRDPLLTRQRDDGAWEGDFSREYATASALVALQIPDSQLATFRPAVEKTGGDRGAKE